MFLFTSAKLGLSQHTLWLEITHGIVVTLIIYVVGNIACVLSKSMFIIRMKCLPGTAFKRVCERICDSSIGERRVCWTDTNWVSRCLWPLREWMVERKPRSWRRRSAVFYASLKLLPKIITYKMVWYFIRGLVWFHQVKRGTSLLHKIYKESNYC